MDKDVYKQFREILGSNLSDSDAIERIRDHLRANDPKYADTSLEEIFDDILEAAKPVTSIEEMIDDYLEEAKKPANLLEIMYSDLRDRPDFKKGYDSINKYYDYLVKTYSDELKCFSNSDINNIITKSASPAFFEEKQAIFACAINYSNLDTIVIDTQETFLCKVGLRLGENGLKKTLIINGNVGISCGFQMSSGEIYVYGSADDKCGYEMSGGKIYVENDVGNECGYNLFGGEIYVGGNAGDWCGGGMRDGAKIYIAGSAGSSCGHHMLGGEIHVRKALGEQSGTLMSSGTIIVDGKLKKPFAELKTGGKIINKRKEY